MRLTLCGEDVPDEALRPFGVPEARRTLHTGVGLLTDNQKDRIAALFAGDAHVEVEATWGVYQRMISAYRPTDRAQARELMTSLITDLSTGGPSRWPSSSPWGGP